MPYGLYISAEGAQAQQRRLETISNNLANVETVGFKRDLAIFQARYAEEIKQGTVSPGTGSFQDIGGGVEVAETKTDYSPAAFKHTGNATDVAIRGEGFFVVRKGQETLLTRAGNFRLTTTGDLVTQQGYQVMADNNTPVNVVPGGGRWDINASGVLTQAGNPQNLAIVKPGSLGDLAKTGENLFRPLGDLRPVTEVERGVAPGYLETSGTEPTREMLAMIETLASHRGQRQHDEVARSNAQRPDQPRAQSVIGSQDSLSPHSTVSEASHDSSIHLRGPPRGCNPLRPNSASSPTIWRTHRRPGSSRAGRTSKTCSTATRCIPVRKTAPANYTPTGIAIGTGCRVSSTQANFSQGTAKQTGNELDVGIEGAGFFQVMDPTGTIYYTRAGNFSKNSNGNVVLSSASIGRLLEPPITVPPDATNIVISAEGIVSVRQPGSQQLSEIGRIELANFINPQGLVQLGENLFGETDASGPPTNGIPGQDGRGTLRQGELENSNVEPVTELIDLISTQRGL